MKAWKELKRASYRVGVKLTTRVNRDYFSTQVSAHVTDPNTVRALMKRTSLNTTSRYMSTIPDRLKEAVKNLGASAGGNSLHKPDQKRILITRAAKRLSKRIKMRKNGGRSRT